jgi:hypothetical protein
MKVVKDLNSFEQSVENLAKTVYSSEDFSNIYSINKKEDNKKTKIYNTQFENMDVSIEVFSIYSLMNYKLVVKENNKPIGSLEVDQGPPDENPNNEKTLFYKLASTNIDNNEQLKDDLVNLYLKDIVSHMQKELDEKLKITPSNDPQKVDYQSVIEKMRKRKEQKQEEQLPSSVKNKM